MHGPGLWGIIIVAVVVVVLFGRGKISGVMGEVASGIKAFQKGMRDEDKPQVTTAAQVQAPAAETEKRCKALAGTFTGKKTAILEEAKETQEKGARMLEIYLDESSDALDGFEFLTMAEAGEVGHWEVLQQLAKTAGNREVKALVAWALPIQKRHFDTARKTSANTVEPMRMNMTKLESRVVESSASRSMRQLSRRLAAARASAPTAPRAPASVGVAMPTKIEPSTRKMSMSGGTITTEARR